MRKPAVSPKYKKKHLCTRTCSRCGEQKPRNKFILRKINYGPPVCRQCEQLGHILSKEDIEKLKKETGMAFYRIEAGSFTVIIRTDDFPIPDDFKPF
jgi:NAD-dependent SIR2 family protein deacetylase